METMATTPLNSNEQWTRFSRKPSAGSWLDIKLEEVEKQSDTSDDGPPSPGLHRMLFAEEGKRGHHRSPYRWIAELSSLLVGIAFMLIIVIVLAAADGNPAPQWAGGVTLNTLLAFLATFCKIAFMFPIVQGLGQLKWMWFMARDAKPLNDFNVFDDATRGSWGSFRLLLRFKGRLACLGALITISGFMTSTLTQQAIGYQQRPAETNDPSEFARVERATSCNIFNGTGLNIGPWEVVREKQALVNGAFHVPDIPIPDLAPECSSGHCSWEPYGTIGICSEVVNLTAVGNQELVKNLTALTFTRLGALFNKTTAFKEDGLLYSIFPVTTIPESFPIITGPMDRPTGTFNNSVNELFGSNYFLAYSDSLLTGETLLNATFNILEIAFFWCTRTLQTKVDAGVPKTVTLGANARSLTPNPHVLNFPWAPDFFPCYAANTCDKVLGNTLVELEPPPGLNNSEKYTANVWTALLGSIGLGETLYNSILMDASRGIVTSTGGGIGEAFATSLFGDFMKTESPPPDVQLRNVRGVINNMATSLTNYMRAGDTRYLDGNNTITAIGKVYTPQTFVHIHWKFIALLATQILLTSLFLAGTVVATYKAGIQILKGSSIAALCGLDKETRNHLGGIVNFDKLKHRAGNTNVRLNRGSSGTALWLGMNSQ